MMPPFFSQPEAFFAIAQHAQRKALQARKRKLARQNRSPTRSATSAHVPQRSSRQQIGDCYEQAAWQLLEQAGCTLLARQLGCPVGELDLVVREGAELVFAEVRRRASARFGGAAASVSAGKQRRLLRAAQWWLPALVRRHFAGRVPPCRLDVITFGPEGGAWHRDAVRLAQDK